MTMEEQDITSSTVGDELKRIRIQKRLDFEKIAEKTRINTKYLEAIENNQFDFLHKPYVVAFVKAYARALGLNPEEYREKLEQHFSERSASSGKEQSQSFKSEQTHPQKPPYPVAPVFQPESLSESKSTPEEKARQRQRPTILFLAIVAVAILVYAVIKFLCGPKEPLITQPIQKPPVVVQDTVVPPLVQKPQESPLTLRLEVKDSLWFRIVVDDSFPSEYSFYSGNSRNWTAKSKFEIRAGKSTGFNLYFNGQLLTDLGTEKERIDRLVLTKDGIIELKKIMR